MSLTVQLFHHGQWHDAAELIADLVPPETLLTELSKVANKLVGPKARLSGRRVPTSVLEMPAMGFDYLDQKLRSWRLM